jgi:hypothetical protein
MNQNRNENWRELCKAAANEVDPNKLMDLITELNKALEERDGRRTTPAEAIEGGTFPTESAV